ncbi:MAG: 2-C-methyl-D-erythritol 4-phosphate cytidylyltransferase [Bacilli bacterium]|nr:2-C-methyl-D-erythritol 4-phosphate cytidylyltransferase [Bacilli bacterium]MDD4077122.1 2-C-methyl-D-erythritol 4-phosphate cytidylyltransferase [Bacilli bacterium]MDD4388989.1 2-C-methyl-D-erythritol 4-phosphate cytidylyltransferase [Bacilli bacterium]
MFDAILVMAGAGERTGLPYNKNLYKIKDKPLFRYSLDLFMQIPQCRQIIVVVSEKDYLAVKGAIFGLDDTKIKMTFGGPFRQDSVANGIRLAVSDIVLIHDAARPLLKKEKILDIYYKAKEFGCAVLAVKAIDTIYRINKNSVELINRDELWHIQTPQAVSRQMFQEAYETAQREKYIATDDISLIRKKFDINPKIVEGSYDNIKVTYERDLRIVEYMIERGYYGI